MYNLFVDAAEDAWDGTPTTFLTGRCLNPEEYTNTRLAEEYGDLTPDQVAELKRLPSVFACETGCKRDAQLGRIVAIRKRRNEVRVEYELFASHPPISNETLLDLKWELGIENNELYRTHWALKDKNLSASLAQAGFPQIPFVEQPLINIHNHVFDVALSFPGEVRDYVETVARQLDLSLGPNRVFYDHFYKAQLAIPNLDTALQALYRERARLVVAFLSKDYASKKWCGIEFKAIREILNDKDDERVMYVRHDAAEIAGVFSYDGYIDANTHSEIEIAAMINERIQILDLGIAGSSDDSPD